MAITNGLDGNLSPDPPPHQPRLDAVRLRHSLRRPRCRHPSRRKGGGDPARVPRPRVGVLRSPAGAGWDVAGCTSARFHQALPLYLFFRHLSRVDEVLDVQVHFSQRELHPLEEGQQAYVWVALVARDRGT